MGSWQLNLSTRKRGKSCTARKLWNTLIAPFAVASSFFPLVWIILWRWVGIDEEEAVQGRAGRRQTEPAKSDKWRVSARESNCIRRKKLGRKDMRNWCAALAMGAILAFPLC